MIKERILSVLTHEMTAIEIERHLKANYSDRVGLCDLYVALRRLEREGLIFRRWELEQEQVERVFLYGDDVVVCGARRVYYRRTGGRIEPRRSLLDKLAEKLSGKSAAVPG